VLGGGCPVEVRPLVSAARLFYFYRKRFNHRKNKSGRQATIAHQKKTPGRVNRASLLKIIGLLFF
jgi:hypothetical protein